MNRTIFAHTASLFVTALIFGTLLSVLAGHGAIASGSLSLRFDFSEPTVRGLAEPQGEGAASRLGRDLIEMPDTMLTMVPGRPALPFRTVRILLPRGTDFAGIEVTAPESRVLSERFEPIITPAMAPLSFGKQIARRNEVRRLLGVFPENADPGAKEPFPGVLYDNFSIQRLDGYTLVFVNLYPLDYDPAEKRAELRSTIEVSISLRPAAVLNGRPKARASDFNAAAHKRVSAMAVNPEVLKTYPRQAASAGNGNASQINGTDGKSGKNCPEGYLIISSGQLLGFRGENSFHTLADRLTADGFVVSMAAVEEILEATRGADSAEKVRNYIREAHENSGVRLVLLGGDGDSSRPVVPVRKMRARFDWEGQNFDQDLPGDVYYSCLDGSWDSNGNGRFGEPDDGEEGGDIDLLAEVFVGRATVANTSELQNFVRKTMAARDMAREGRRGVILFSGESLFPGIYGKTYMGEVQYGADVHGFRTSGIPEGYPFDHLFDLDASWGRREVTEKLNSGPYWINHVGHSAQYTNMRLSTSSPGGLTNATPYLLYTQGCYCGQFTYDDCVIEKHLTAKNGAFATLSNSSYGLGPEDPDPDASVQCRGASQYFHRQFVDAVFGEGKARLGEANQDSKEDNIPFMNHGTTRWVFFEMNLFGDPAVELVK